MADSFTIEVDGLKETIKALGKVDKDLRKEAGQITRKYAVMIKSEAWARLQKTPGVSRKKYKLTKGALTHRATATAASVGINRSSSVGRNAAIFGAEFGARKATLPINRGTGKKGSSRGTLQNKMRRRTFPVWRGNATTVRGKSGPGWVILPVLRKRVPQIEEAMETELVARFNLAARRAGVPRG